MAIATWDEFRNWLFTEDARIFLGQLKELFLALHV